MTNIRSPIQMRAEFDKALAPYWIDKLIYPESRENALKVLSKKRDLIPDLGPLLWNSFGSFSILLMEITKAYTYITPPTLSDKQSGTVCNALALMQSIASHPETKPSIMKAGVPLYLYPLFRTDDKRKAFEYLRLASLGVIGALVKDDDRSAVFYLLKSEIIPSCLKLMENGTELCRTLATFILQRILKEAVGVNFISNCWYKLTEVLMSLEQVVLSVLRNPSARLLKHVLRCYLHLSRDLTAVRFVRAHLPLHLRDVKFVSFLRQHNLYDLYSELLTNLNLEEGAVGIQLHSLYTTGVSTNTLSTAKSPSSCCTVSSSINPSTEGTVPMAAYCSAGVLPVVASVCDEKFGGTSRYSSYSHSMPCDNLGAPSYSSAVVGQYLCAPNTVTISPDVSGFGSNKMSCSSGAVTVSSNIPDLTSISHCIPVEIGSSSDTQSIVTTSDTSKSINMPLYCRNSESLGTNSESLGTNSESLGTRFNTSNSTYKAFDTQHIITSNYSPYTVGVYACAPNTVNIPDYFISSDSPSPDATSTVDSFPDSPVSNHSLQSSSEAFNMSVSSGNRVQISQYSPCSFSKSKNTSAGCGSLSAYSSGNFCMSPVNYSPNVNISIVPNSVNICSYPPSAYGANMSLYSSLTMSSSVGTPNAIGSTCYSPTVTAGIPFVPGTLHRPTNIPFPSSSCTVNGSSYVPQTVGILPHASGTAAVSPYASCPIGMPYVPSALATSYYISVTVSTVPDTPSSVSMPSYVGKSLHSPSTVTTSTLSTSTSSLSPISSK